jgi:hypothetical protein
MPGRFFQVTRRKIPVLYFANRPDSLLTAPVDVARTDAHSWADDSRGRLPWARQAAKGFLNHASD